MSMFFYWSDLHFFVEDGRYLWANYGGARKYVRAEGVEDRKRITCAVGEWETLTTYQVNSNPARTLSLPSQLYMFNGNRQS